MNYIKINKHDIANGPGCRVVLWVAGCDHCCPGCHNPQSWDTQAGIPFTSETFHELVEALTPNYISGLTFSGGDPLHPQNRDEVYRVAAGIKQRFPQKHIWCWTGYLWEQVKDLPVMQYLDYLVDGPYIEAQRDISLAYAGSRNQRVIEVKTGRVCR